MKQQIPIIICNRCGKSDLKDGVLFCVPILIKNGERLDLCDECDETGCFMCSRCETVHTHEADCKYLRNQLPIIVPLNFQLPY